MLASLRELAKAHPRLRIFFWAALIMTIFGAIEAGEPLEDVLKAGRDYVRSQPASGEIVVVGVDDRTGAHFGGFSYSRSIDAKLVDNLFALGARRVFFDRVYADATSPEGDQAFAAALARHRGRVFLGAISPYVNGWKGSETLPRPMFQKVAEYRWLNGYNTPFYLSANLTFGIPLNGKIVPSLSSELAGESRLRTGYYRPDWSIQIDSIPTVSQLDVVQGRTRRADIAGKDVVVGPTSASLQDIHPILSQGQHPGVYFHVVGAETLRKGDPRNWGWVPAFVLGLLLSALFLMTRRRLTRVLTIAAVPVIMLAVPLNLNAHLIELDVVPALILFAIVAYRGSTLVRVETSRRTNPASDLPNLLALAEREGDRADTLVALKLRNHAQIVASFPRDIERDLFQDLKRRVCVAGGVEEVYHGEDALFWFSKQPANDELVHHLRGLHKLLSQSVRLEDRDIDLLTSFGVDADVERPVKSRIASAALCAEEAARTNEVWKVYDAQRSHAAAWQLSLMSRLDMALENGEIWVAYQPKVSLATRQIIGAEALIRWNHPTAGALSPDQFIPAAEAHNRIGQITYFVLERSLMDLAELHRLGHDLGIAVNLSPQLLHEPDLVANVMALLDRYDVARSNLTLEVTETGELLTDPANIETLERLAATGIQLSIDDYGTGNATLEYLSRLPTQEVKIDRTFITDLDSNKQNLILVRSTLEMAHKLGRHVVAEGVENEAVMQVLRRLGCDVAQGYLLSRPVPFGELWSMLDRDQGSAKIKVVIS
jgi:diguanylate cyclase